MKTEFFNPFALSLGKNPFDSVQSTKPVFVHRGVSIYKRFDRAFVYLVDGVCVTERGGYSREAIDTMLDGKNDAGNKCPWERERYDWALATGKAQKITAPFS